MTKDMVEGSSIKILIEFTIPMILGNIFQQLYNTTDAIIVGKYIGKNALAAVGVSNPIVSIAIFFMFGLCIGMSVLVSQFVGAKKYDDLKKEVSTALIAGTLFTIVISIVCIALSKYFLIMSGTPEEIVNDADTFLKITFGGLIFSFLYNFYSSSLRAIGDSKTPLIFLITSCVLNGILCIVFVAVFKLGIAGSALATVIAQGISALFCIIYVYIKIPMIRLKLNHLVLDKLLLRETIQYSWASALQQASLYIGRLLIQGVVNSFGTNAIAAYNSGTRVEGFVLAPGDSIAAAMATYVAQNKGAGKSVRIIDGYKNASIMITMLNIVITLFVFIGAEPLMKLFVSGSETQVIALGVEYLHRMSVFYVLAGIGAPLQGIFRGVGKLKIILVSTVLSISVRVSVSYILSQYLGISSVVYGIAAGWVFLTVYGLVMRIKYFKEIASLTAKVA